MDDYVDAAISHQLRTLAFIALLLGLGKGGVPGLATVATAATVLTAPTHLVGGLTHAVSLMVPVLCVVDIHAAYLHRDELVWSTIWQLLPTSLAGMTIGQYIDGRVSDSTARLIVGMILLGILALQTRSSLVSSSTLPSLSSKLESNGVIVAASTSTTKSNGSLEKMENEELLNYKCNVNNNQHNNGLGESDSCIRRKNRLRDIEKGSDFNASSSIIPPRKVRRMKTKHLLSKEYTHLLNSRTLWVLIIGIIGGSSTMLTNSMGPMVNVYLLSIEGLSPQSYIGTRAMFFCFINVIKIPIRILGGTLGLSMLPLAFGLSLIAIGGVCLAKPIVLSMNERTFAILELGVVAFAGTRLCYLGLVG